MRIEKRETLSEGIWKLQRRADTLDIAMRVIAERARLHGDMELVALIETLLARVSEGDTIKAEWIARLAEYRGIAKDAS
jgi:hypothetical protein